MIVAERLNEQMIYFYYQTELSQASQTLEDYGRYNCSFKKLTETVCLKIEQA